MGRAQVLGLAGPVACACVAQQESNDLLDLLTYVQYLLTHVLPRPAFSPPKLRLSQPAVSWQKVAARIATGPLTVAQHKQRIGAASLKVSAAPLPVCLAAPRPAPARLTRHSDAGLPPARQQRSTLTAHDVLCSQACRSTMLGCRRMQV
jgi:hypothetical protein